jgi:uncharacterized protein with NRDE domain
VCLVAFALAPRPEYAFVLAANRDEAHDRPTRSAAFWADAPLVFGGRDERAGGTWLGVTRRGRVAAVTNVRDPSARRDGRSRGLLVAEVLRSRAPLEDTLRALHAESAAFASFNLVAAEAGEAWYLRDDAPPARVSAGIHGLSNARLDVPWPKVRALREVLRAELASAAPSTEPLFRALGDRTVAPDAELPHTGVPADWERALSAAFIEGESYGTRASTVVSVLTDGHVEIEERSFGPRGRAMGVVRERFRVG